MALLAADEAFVRRHGRARRSSRADTADAAPRTWSAPQGPEACDPPDKGLISLLVDVVLDGVHRGDLRLPEARHPEELACGVCVLALGIGLLMDTGLMGGEPDVEGFRATRAAVDSFLDSQGWRPLSGECDYNATQERVRRELFAEQVSATAGIGARRE